jgi:hypothetical protein
MQNSFLNVPIPTADFLKLVDFLRENDSPLDPVIAIQEAIDDWIAMSGTWSEEDWRRILRLNEDEEREQPKGDGYLWKTVLLPPGSSVRMKYKGKDYHATIEGDAFIYNNKAISPSEFANLVAGGTARNAWRDLWIKRPTDRQFRPATHFRRERNSNEVVP